MLKRRKPLQLFKKLKWNGRRFQLATISKRLGRLDINEVRDGSFETVVIGFPNLYGLLMGKHYEKNFFCNSVVKSGSHACNYLLTQDMEQNVMDGYDFASWEKGFGDFHLAPDISTLRHLSWRNETAFLICDIENPLTHELVSIAPRSILKNQVTKLKRMGLMCNMASELEYFLYKEDPRVARRKDFKNLQTVSDIAEDYHLIQMSREEDVQAKFRRHLYQSGIDVECTKGETGLGQHEINVRYAETLEMADTHTLLKQCLREVAEQMGMTATFMAKPYTHEAGSGCHVHLSLHAADSGENAFLGDKTFGKVKNCSDAFHHFIGGLIRFTPEVFPFYAPTVNSYKRFIPDSWAPTKLAWSFDNRTAGFRVVGDGKSRRIEVRIAGADVNPYLFFSAILACGIEGMQQKIKPPPYFEGNVYSSGAEVQNVPTSMQQSILNFQNSSFAKKAFGEDVVSHYSTFYQKELDAHNNAVTDWERLRYFDRI